MNQPRIRLLFAVILLALLALGVAPAAPTTAQGAERYFPETQHYVKGLFLTYWDAHGGLPQQGYPLTEAFPELSPLDGKTYTVQYFERAVFEHHSENAGTPFEVLLAQLGRYELDARYPNNSNGNAAPVAPPKGVNLDARYFPETQHSVWSVFLKYWNEHGGLAQQGYPLTEEFAERSTLDGKTYTVQYFERAVFEHHPENAGTPFEVLLTQLGKYQLTSRYPNNSNPAAAPTGPNAPPPVAQATPTAPPAAKAGWTSVAAENTGPAARYDHSTVFDPVRNQLVVYGGRGGRDFGDTWIFEFATRRWREGPGGPQARHGQGAVYDGPHRRMIVVMGQGTNGFFNDVWAFDLDGEAWTQLSESRTGAGLPRPRYGQSAALDSRGRVLISHGFSDQGRFDDTWAFDPATGQWTDLNPGGARPLKRCLHELAYDGVGDRLFLFGGCSSGFGPCPQGDLWVLDLRTNTWAELAPAGAAPAPRSNPSFVYDPAGMQIFLFGGGTGSPNSETWLYDPARNAWASVPTSATPGARSSQGASYDALARRVLLFGGLTPVGPSTEIWIWQF